MSKRLHIIHDTSPASRHATPRGMSKGLREAGGYAGVADPFPDELLVPESEYQARIQEKDEQKSWMTDNCDRVGSPVKNQQQTNYCWINAPTRCLEIVRVLQNEEKVVLSPASAGAQIKNYRNVGGWGKEGLEWIIEHGVCPVSAWPANAIDRRYATPENKALALKYRAVEWFELEPGNLRQLFSCALRDIPIAVGYNWWSHEVTVTRLHWIDGEVALGIDNSWDVTWGDNGRGVIQGRRMRPDDAVAPRTALAA